MGSVFGCLSAHPFASDEHIASLLRWNEQYGTHPALRRVSSNFVLGAFFNPLKDRILPESVIEIDEWIAVADVLLYNRDELEEQLRPGFSCEYLSDEELLLRFALERGFDALKTVNGDFAAVLYHTQTQELILLRDHLGVRPLYYYLDAEIFAFSTDIRGLLGIPGVDTAPAEELLYLNCMGYNDLTLCETTYRKIHCIRPGAWTELRPFTETREPDLSVRSYWEPGRVKVRLESEDEYIAGLRRLITDSLQRRADAISGPIGCELSGGLDSSTLAILLNRLGREGRFFSWSYSEEDLPITSSEDERNAIADICRQENIRCAFTRKKKTGDFVPFAESLNNNDVPFINTTSIREGAKFLRSQNARVVISGHGGDEGVSHRCNFYELWYNKEYLQFFTGIYRGTRGVRPRLACWAVRVLRQFFVIHPAFRKPFHSGNNIEPFMNEEFVRSMSGVERPVHTFAYDSARYILQGGLRNRLDNTAAQGAEAGVQYIFPYLDYRVLDYALGVPRYLYQNGRGTRWLFREAFRDIMPASLYNVHYKDTPSLRGRSLSEAEIEELSGLLRQDYSDYISFLDREPWNRYFRFDKLREVLEQKIQSENDMNRVSNIQEMLYPYILMQNLNDKLTKL